MSTTDVPMNAGPASTAGETKNAQSHQASPTSVAALSIDVNSPPQDQHSVASSADSKSRRSRRRRKGKARGNQVEPVAASSPRHRNNNNNHYNNHKKKKNGGNNNSPKSHGNNNHDSSRSSSFRSPIVTWRGKNNGSRNNSNNRYNNNNNSSNHNRHNNNNGKTWNHPSPRFSKYATNPVCPASTGYPTSKKQHDAPMKKRDLYFSLHVERVGIATHHSKGSENENAPKEGSREQPDAQQQQQKQQQQEHEQKAVARVTVTNWENEFVLDTFVAIPVPVVDFYDTGIRPENVEARASTHSTEESRDCNGAAASDSTTENFPSSFAGVRAKVERILRGKILIGYELDEGLQALGLSHPNTDMRDCSVYFKNDDDASATRSVSLEELSQKELNRPFESAKARIAKDSPNHNSDVMILGKDSSVSRKPVHICVTTMDLYKNRRNEWETALIAQARERERQQQSYLLKISQQRQQEQQKAQRQAQQQAQQKAAQQYRESLTTVSLHCEMVRTALSGRTKTLARVTLVDGRSRNVLLDEFCQIPVPVTDFCETGITENDVMIGSSNGHGNTMDAPPSYNSNPMPLSVLRGHVERILRGRLLVGYKVEESLKALGLTHPWMQVRDIAYFPPFLHTKMVGGATSVVTVRSLDDLSEEFLRHVLRPLGDRARPVDLCHCALALYDTFRDQWERRSQSQQQEVFLQQQQQQVQAHQHDLQSRMVPPSPSTMMQSPHLRLNHYYGQQPRTPTYNSPMAMPPSPQQQLQQQRQVLMPEQQKQYSDVPSRTNANSSSWFAWGKQQMQQPSNLVGASQTLSSQALQVLQEDYCEQGPPSPRSHFLPVSSHSAFAERTSSYDGSTYGESSEFSGVTSEFYTESVISSMRDESSIISGDHVLPPEPKCESSSLPSSWFRLRSKKSKDQGQDDIKSNCETMAAVQEEVLTDDGMLPTPTQLFPPLDSEDDATKPLAKTANKEGKEDGSLSDASSSSPLAPRSWFGFRKSPVPKERPQSRSSSFSESTIEHQPEGAATEASIEITLSIPASTESDDTVSPLVEKSATTSLSCRPSSSWFGFRRSSKSSGSKNNSLNPNALGKESFQSEALCHPDLKMSPTERTAAMDEDWLQEIMSQSTGGTEEIEPWMGQAKTGELGEKPLSASRGQASWFGFKRSKALLASLGNANESLKADSPNEDGAWSDRAPTGRDWFPEEANASIPLNIEENFNNNVFHTRARLSTESTIPSVTTEEPEEETLESESFSKDLDFGAAQSLSFLEI